MEDNGQILKISFGSAAACVFSLKSLLKIPICSAVIGRSLFIRNTFSAQFRFDLHLFYIAHNMRINAIVAFIYFISLLVYRLNTLLNGV